MLNLNEDYRGSSSEKELVCAWIGNDANSLAMGIVLEINRIKIKDVVWLSRGGQNNCNH